VHVEINEFGRASEDVFTSSIFGHANRYLAFFFIQAELKELILQVVVIIFSYGVSWHPRPWLFRTEGRQILCMFDDHVLDDRFRPMEIASLTVFAINSDESIVPLFLDLQRLASGGRVFFSIIFLVVERCFVSLLVRGNLYRGSHYEVGLRWRERVLFTELELCFHIEETTHLADPILSRGFVDRSHSVPSVVVAFCPHHHGLRKSGFEVLDLLIIDTADIENRLSIVGEGGHFVLIFQNMTLFKDG